MPDTTTIAAADSSLLEAARRMHTGVAIVDDDQRLVSANPAFAARLGLPRSVGGQCLAAAVVEVEPATEVERLRALLDDHGASTIQLTSHVVLHIGPLSDDRRVVLAEWPHNVASVAGPAPVGADRLDPLTGLGDRRRLDQVLAAWTDDETPSPALTALMIDLDRFKQVNDTLGHAAGDKLLGLVADRIRSAVRGDEEVIRIGGDEFVVLLAGGDLHVAEPIAMRIVEFLDRPFLLEGQQVNIGASIGIATLGDGPDATADLLRHADLALYAAKAAGRNTHRVFHDELEVRALERRDLEIRLRRAIMLREFWLAYQPQVDVATGTVVGFEALLRWDCADLGPIPPDRFIPVAEEVGEMHAIGEWVLKHACLEATTWPDELRVAVNVSPIQFQRADFATVVADALSRSGLAPERLELEITEGVLLSDSEQNYGILHELRELGVQIALDDFGTGYSSLSHLNNFPFSTLKIDQSFVRGAQSERSRRLVMSIISLGESLGMSTIAEGVETADQLRELTDEGCRQVQGYYVARPMPPADVPHFIARHGHGHAAAPVEDDPRPPRSEGDAS